MRFSSVALALLLVACGGGSMTDAGTDAGSVDSGRTDAGPGDGGPTDGGTTDGGPTDLGPGDGGTPDTGTPDAGPPSAQPPAPPVGAPAPTGAGTAFVITHLYLGDTDRGGAGSTDAWRSYGYDLDHRTSTATSTDVCAPRAGASAASAYPDGDDGTDNAFGSHLLPILLGIAADVSTQVNASIASGGPNELVSLDALGAGSDLSPISGGVLLTVTTSAPPTFAGTDVFDVDPASLASPTTPITPTAAFSDAYLVRNTLVARPTGAVRMVLRVGTVTIPFSVEHAIVTMDVSADHSSATGGTIAGILQVDALLAALTQAFGSFDPSLCGSTILMSILDQVEQAADIMADGTQDPTMTCDGISIGLGFDAVAAQVGAIAPPAPPPTDPCP